jgi:hypothetical protein
MAWADDETAEELLLAVSEEAPPEQPDMPRTAIAPRPAAAMALR